MELEAAPEPRAARDSQQEEEEDTSVIRETQIGKGGAAQAAWVASLVWLAQGSGWLCC